MLKNKNSKTKVIAGLAVLAGGVALACPKVSADSNFEVYIPDKPILEIELDQNNIRFEMDPTLTKPDFKTKTLTITSSTNSTTGYSVYMTTTKDSSLVRTTQLNGSWPEIKSLELRGQVGEWEDYTESDFTVNSWGYQPSGYNKWKSIPKRGYQILVDSNSEAIIEKESQVSFGVKVDSTLPSGWYTGTINFSIVANSPEIESFSSAMNKAGKETITVNNEEYYKMQDMTASICNSVAVDETAQLVDIRDNKIYWVLKARDGHCWMTQNLDHNIVTTENFYTPENTDIRSNWTPINGTIITTGREISGVPGDAAKFAPYSVDVGDWYWDNTYTWYETTLANTKGQSFVDNDKFNENTSYAANGAHGHVGNYYNWSAAVALNDTSGYTTDEEGESISIRTSSICPAGWRLPIVEGGYNDKTNDFENLVTAYNSNTYDSQNKDDKIVIASPLFFVRSGYMFGDSYYNNIVTKVDLDEIGFYLSGTIEGVFDGFARGFWLDSNHTSASTGGGRDNLYSIRCMAR